MKVELVTSPHTRHPDVLQNDFSVTPSVMMTFIPVGLLSLVAATRSSTTVDPSIFDLNRRILSGDIPLGAGFYADAAEAICESAPDVVGFMTENESYHHVLQICHEIKRVKPDAFVVLGGPHASAVAAATLRSWECVDFVVSGEGEATFPELLQAVGEGTSPVAGVWQRGPDGTPAFGGDRPLVSDLDSLPYPAYDLYRPDPNEEIFFEVGRGCPFQCTFCSTAPFWRRKHRVKSPRRIIEELKHVSRLYGSRRMHFTHDLFTTHKAWVRKVCNALIEANLGLSWTCSSRTDTVDADLLALMAEAGCSAIYFGLESGSQRMLAEIKKNIDIDHSFAVLQQCLDVGIAANVGFIGGLPGEDVASLAQTFAAFESSLAMGCSPVYIFQFTPFADSSVGPTLTDTVSTGHFVDLPLGREQDEANRELVASDDVVFGAYHRPRHAERGIHEEWIDGLEEFPALVSANVLPTITIARQIGGMFDLYTRWIAWISALNDARETSRFRRCFGSPVHFVDFLTAEAEALPSPVPGLVSMLSVLRMNHQIAARQTMQIPTTMATYRTGLASAGWEPLQLSTTLTLGNVVGKLGLPEDVAPLLTAEPPDGLPPPLPGKTYLLWQRTESGDVRLLQVDRFTFHVARELESAPQDAAEILAGWNSDPTKVGERDLFPLIEELQHAESLGLFQRVPAGPHEGSTDGDRA